MSAPGHDSPAVASPCGVATFDMAKSTLSHHFKVLRESGIIRQHDAGTARLSLLRKEELDKRFPGLMDLVLHEARRTRTDPQPVPQDRPARA